MDWSHELIYNLPGLLTCCLLLECRWTDEASAAFNVHIVPMFIQSSVLGGMLDAVARRADPGCPEQVDVFDVGLSDRP